MADDQDQHDQDRAATAQGSPPAVQGKSRDTSVTTVAGSDARLINSPEDALAFYPPGTMPSLAIAGRH
jgi:hypothetical protein